MILVNGQATDLISVTDRGIQYGDGVFETMAVAEGVPLCLTDHLDRLARGCRRLRIPEPHASLQQEIRTVVGRIERGILKIIITRGTGGRGYAPSPNILPTRVVADYPWPDYPARFREEGIETCLCDIRLGRNTRLAGIKHLNRLEQVLGRAECEERDVPEGIMSDTRGHLIEGTMSNLFLVRDNTLITPALVSSGVRGIVRGRIMRIAKMLGIDISVTRLEPSALSHAHGIFFCNSVMGIWPVARFANHHYSIPPLIRRLQRELIERGIVSV
uniref:Aminodeoxychorismate lyase n=1 Tax=Candidatus Kentrum sp. TUN TaxID=2126343 RepID=A0A450ZEG7_9GAMM|nr:MAG: 4-amino-4-deoxychorismate lyase [Candidatus Kentron sp. TUN]VFK52120.1 MAG: 4-amino-4-deoxychorismate lyase [Candidatus Kentron sp. TUN]VFK52160.1 MAG: 4-amino-4-deoxychorismate lyase [Candidatus Kentron sp. TUN]